MNSTIIDKLNSIITNNKLTHAYLFEVNNYDDDFKVILNFVKMILSNMTYDEVINSDINYFKQIDDNKYIDLFIVEPDGNNIKKNQMIDLMTEFNDKSFLNNKRIYIIKECDKLNASSANTILKFLEEPNDNIIGILLTDNRYRVIDTVLSRCQIYSFNNNDTLVGIEEYDDLFEFVFNIKKKINDYDLIFNKYFVDKTKSIDNIKYIQNILINYLDNKENDYKFIKDIDYNTISNIILVLEKEKTKLEFNVNQKLWFEDLLVSLLEVLE